jgi:hypothetical protein
MLQRVILVLALAALALFGVLHLNNRGLEARLQCERNYSSDTCRGWGL